MNLNRSAIAALLPMAFREALIESRKQNAFRSSIPFPKVANKGLVERAIDGLVFQHLPESVVLEGKGLLASEKKYVLDVVAEYRAWQVEEEKKAKEQAEAPVVAAQDVVPAAPPPAVEVLPMVGYNQPVSEVTP